MKLPVNAVIAVVGASRNQEKFGHKVCQNLLQRGYQVIPINPKAEQILERSVYPTLTDYAQSASAQPLDLVVFVVPPTITRKILPEVQKLGVKQVWFQPGSFNDKVIEFCQQHGIKFEAQACILRYG